MMRLLSHLALVALLFVNIEGVAELADHGQPHDHPIPHEHAHHSSDSGEGVLAHAEANGAHCDHCCHVHFSSIAHLHPISASIEYSGQELELTDGAIPEFFLSPPTPPPDPTYLS